MYVRIESGTDYETTNSTEAINNIIVSMIDDHARICRIGLDGDHLFDQITKFSEKFDFNEAGAIGRFNTAIRKHLPYMCGSAALRYLLPGLKIDGIIINELEKNIGNEWFLTFALNLNLKEIDRSEYQRLNGLSGDAHV